VAGFELRLDDRGGRLLDRDRSIVLLRWFLPEGAHDYAEQVWFLPREAIGPVEAPESSRTARLWSLPRFEVD
jgi:hypothetical protein